jgi:polyisoprenoid-binding protein YceI
MTLVLAVLVAAAPLTLEGDPAHTSAGFSVKHMVVTTVRGEFTKVNSTLHWNKDDPAKSTVEMKIDAASINTNNEKRDTHLKSPDFFDVQKCPDITFKSSKVEKESGDKYKVSGDLTMHCITKPVALEVAFTDQPVKTPFGTTVYAASASGKVKRSDWSLNWNKTLESGGVVLSDEVKLDVDVEYISKPAEAKKEAQAETKK